MHVHARLKQLVWFVVLWAGGVAVVTLVAYGIRMWLSTA